MNFLATSKRGQILPNPDQAARVAVWLAALKPDTAFRVSLEKETKRRTLKQNSRYWALILPAFSAWTGYEEFPESAEKLGLAPKDSAHEVLKAMFIGEREAVLPNGQVVKIRPSTAKLSTKEMADLQDKSERFLNENNIFLPADERFL